MKKDKLKKLRLTAQTLEPVKNPDVCLLLLGDIQMEMPEEMRLSPVETSHHRQRMSDGTLQADLEIRGIRSDLRSIAHLRISKQAEILDYNFFRSRLSETVVTDLQAEIVDFSTGRKLPMEVKRLELSFNNGKRVNLTDRVSVHSLNRLAA